MELEHSAPLALTTTQLLKRLKISRSALYKLVKDGRLTPLPLFKRNKLFSYEQIVELFKTPKK